MDQIRYASSHSHRAYGRWRCLAGFSTGPEVENAEIDEELAPCSSTEKRTLVIIGLAFMLWMTKGLHGIDYSVTGMLGVAALVLAGVLEWKTFTKTLSGARYG